MRRKVDFIDSRSLYRERVSVYQSKIHYDPDFNSEVTEKVYTKRNTRLRVTLQVSLTPRFFTIHGPTHGPCTIREFFIHLLFSSKYREWHTQWDD